MSDYTPTTEEVVLPPLNEEVIKGLALLGLDQMVGVDDERAEQFEDAFDRWFAEVKAQERKDERKRLIEVLEEYRSDLYEFADSSARNDGDPAWFIGRASEVESCITLIKGATE